MPLMVFDPNEPHSETIANFALMETEPGAMERYWRLAVETSQYEKRLKADGNLGSSSWREVHDAERVKKFLIPKIAPEHHDASLFERWDAWGEEYERIYSASPKWRLKEMISEISETHHCISWPKRWERDIWEWATADGEEVVCPFVDRRSVIDENFRIRMQGLIRECDGFLYRCEEIGQVVFAPTEELPRIWKHQDHLAAIDRQKPFGFFYDMSRPNSQEYTRELSALEGRMLAATRSPRGLRGALEKLGKAIRRNI